MPDHFCLKWSDFQSSIVTALESLKCSEDLVDVTLTCEGQNIKAHKVVLSACSPYFRAVFKENPCQHPVIILKDVMAADLTRLLAYMYQGEVTILEEHLPALIQTAELLQVSGLTSHTITPLAKQKVSKAPLPAPVYVPPNTQQRRIVPQAISLLKKPAIVPTVQIPVLKTYQPRKKRSSSSEPVDLAPPDHLKKSKITKDTKHSTVLAKVTESTSSGIEKAKTENEKDGLLPDDTEQTTLVKNTESQNSEGVLPDVKIKQEINSQEEDEHTQLAEEEQSDPKGFYGSSMLARSLISGAQSIKGDALTASPVNKPAVQTAAETPFIEIKTENLSPGAGGFEPEIVISEEENRSVSNVGNLPANHAAICGDCPHCGTQYSNQSALKYHVRLMHSDLTNRLCCYLCPRSFTVRDTFKEHMWTFHGQRN